MATGQLAGQMRKQVSILFMVMGLFSSVYPVCLWSLLIHLLMYNG